MNIIITRVLDDGKETLGQVTGDFFCDSLERPWLNNQHGISCIPVGVYTCKWSHMVTVDRDHYQVMNVPDRDAIFIHGGNFFVDTHGCILLANSEADINDDGEVDLTNSSTTIKAFETLMNKQDFTLTIITNG